MSGRSARLLLALLVTVSGCAHPPSPAANSVAGTTVAAPLPPDLRAELYPQWITLQPQIKWPPNDGCAAAPVAATLPAGTLIDRFGSETGRYFSPRGESFASRALPYVCSRMTYTVYRVQKPLKVMACKAAAWFDEPGGAEQFQTADAASTLRQGGVIAVVAEPNAGSAVASAPCGGH